MEMDVINILYITCQELSTDIGYLASQIMAKRGPCYRWGFETLSTSAVDRHRAGRGLHLFSRTVCEALPDMSSSESAELETIALQRRDA
jgi:hypothetical protein